MIGIGDDVAPLLAKLADFQPKLVFNGCEGFRKNARHEYAIAALLDMYGYRYTGSSPTALLVARNKSLTKKRSEERRVGKEWRYRRSPTCRKARTIHTHHSLS